MIFSKRGVIWVKVEISIEPGRTEPKIVIHAAELTDELARLADQLSGAREPVPVQTDRGLRLLSPEEILRIYAQRKRVYAQTAEGVFPLKYRLYEMEQRLGESFLRISASELVNERMILGMDFSLTGTIRLTLRGGVTTYVSRRQVAKIKKHFER